MLYLLWLFSELSDEVLWPIELSHGLFILLILEPSTKFLELFYGLFILLILEPSTRFLELYYGLLTLLILEPLTDSLIPATKLISIVNFQSLKLPNGYHKNLISFQEYTLDTSTSYQSLFFQTVTSWSTPNNICYGIYLTVD